MLLPKMENLQAKHVGTFNANRSRQSSLGSFLLPKNMTDLVSVIFFAKTLQARARTAIAGEKSRGFCVDWSEAERRSGTEQNERQFCESKM